MLTITILCSGDWWVFLDLMPSAISIVSSDCDAEYFGCTTNGVGDAPVYDMCAFPTQPQAQCHGCIGSGFGGGDIVILPKASLADASATMSLL